MQFQSITTAFNIFWIAAKALYCYVCASDESFEECTKTQRKQECPALRYDRCYYQYIEYSDSQGKTIKSYTKGCSYPSACSRNTRAICQQIAERYGGAICEVTCCRGGVCNEPSSSVSVTSSILLLTRAVVVILAIAHWWDTWLTGLGVIVLPGVILH